MWRSEEDTVWVQGYRAVQDNPAAVNPYEPLTPNWEEWAEGYRMACADMVHGYNNFPTNLKDLNPPLISCGMEQRWYDNEVYAWTATFYPGEE